MAGIGIAGQMTWDDSVISIGGSSAITQLSAPSDSNPKTGAYVLLSRWAPS